MAVYQLPQTDVVDLPSSRGQASLGLGDLSIGKHGLLAGWSRGDIRGGPRRLTG
jgi:hypothetical protein